MTDSKQDIKILENLANAQKTFFHEIGKVIIGQKKILEIGLSLIDCGPRMSQL